MDNEHHITFIFKDRFGSQMGGWLVGGLGFWGNSLEHVGPGHVWACTGLYGACTGLYGHVRGFMGHVRACMGTLNPYLRNKPDPLTYDPITKHPGAIP